MLKMTSVAASAEMTRATGPTARAAASNARPLAVRPTASRHAPAEVPVVLVQVQRT
jgi:hypothetical protein